LKKTKKNQNKQKTRGRTPITQIRCSQLDLAEFYDNISVTEGKVSSTVNGVEFQKKVKAHVIDEVGSSTLMRCSFELIKEVDFEFEQGVQHLLHLFSAADYLLPHSIKKYRGWKLILQR